MASGSQCANSRWDQTRRNDSHPVTTEASSSGSSPTWPPAVGPDPPQAGVEMAAAMAAKINAVLMAKGKLKPLQPLPSKVPLTVPFPFCAVDVVVAEVDINDVPINCRNLLTTGKTQEEIRQFSGAFVTTKDLHVGDAEKCGATNPARRLYLHVQGRSQTDVNNAVARIKEIISEEVLRSSNGLQPPVMPTVPVYRQPLAAAAIRPPNIPTIPGHKPPPPHSGSFVHTKIFVGLDRSQPSFNVNEHVEGRSGSYLQHIQSETGARVFLRGKGSGHIEQASRRESFEPLHLYVSHPNAAGLEAAKKLCENLLETVRAEHTRVTSTYAPSASTVYSTNNSYSSQSWYSYPAYPVSAGFWNNSGQSQLRNSPVQYPVWSREQTPLTQQVCLWIQRALLYMMSRLQVIW
ncbi:KH homology domain-containing protein 4-like isoform X2 [Paramisgurnus dabryanus]|uniref:KH homology domain-containing protein 4-like isoform X2 n=1 Tax=Paramisgurnus dabryanus TaxID=90735 RepID=UPI0031F3D4FD